MEFEVYVGPAFQGRVNLISNYELPNLWREDSRNNFTTIRRLFVKITHLRKHASKLSYFIDLLHKAIVHHVLC